MPVLERCARFAVLLSAALASACPRPAPCRAARFAPGDEAAVRGVLRDQAAAWNRGDLDGFLAGYARSADLVFTSGGGVRRGWQETHDQFARRYGRAPETMGTLAFEVLSVQPVGADGAVVLGRWSLDGPNRGGGVFSVVLERGPGGWQVIHDHTTAVPEPEGDER